MTVVSFHRLAVAEFVRARRWYARRRPSLAAGLVRAVGEAEAAIAANPTAGTSSHPPYLWVAVQRYPYVLHYGPLVLDRWRIYAVAHTSRRPGYWLGRTRRP